MAGRTGVGSTIDRTGSVDLPVGRLALGIAPVVAALLAGALGLHRLTEWPLWHDEVYSVDTARLGWRALAEQVSSLEVNMAAYYALLKGWLAVGGGDAWIRLPSVLWSVAAVVATWALGRQLGDRRLAALGALLLAANAFLLQYAQEARAYTMVVALASMSTAAAVLSHRTERPVAWLAWVASAVLLGYTQVLALGVVAVQVAWLAAVAPAGRRRRVAAAAVAGLALVPLLVAVARQAGGAVGWVPPMTPSGVVWGWGRLLGAGGPGPLGEVGWVLVPALTILAVGGFVGAWRRGPLQRSTAILLGAWVVLPFLGVLAISLVKPLFVPRYLIAILPAVSILAAAGVLALPWRPVRLATATALLALLVGASLGQYGSLPRPDWPAATDRMLERSSAADRSVVIGDWGRVLRYYAGERGAADRVPLRLWRDLDPAAPGFSEALGRTAMPLATEGRTIWVFLSGGDAASADPAADARFAGLRRSYELAAVDRFRLLTLAWDPLESTCRHASLSIL